MKKILILPILVTFNLALPAQNSDKFAYDRQEVNYAMEQINELTAQPGFLYYLRDTAKVDTTSNLGYFFIGFIPGCLVPPAGCFVLNSSVSIMNGVSAA